MVLHARASCITVNKKGPISISSHPPQSCDLILRVVRPDTSSWYRPPPWSAPAIPLTVHLYYPSCDVHYHLTPSTIPSICSTNYPNNDDDGLLVPALYLIPTSSLPFYLDYISLPIPQCLWPSNSLYLTMPSTEAFTLLLTMYGIYPSCDVYNNNNNNNNNNTLFNEELQIKLCFFPIWSS